MSIRNVEDSEDNHFLKGFESPLSNSNMLSELCKVESGLFEPSPRYDVKPEMEEEEGASGGRGSARRKGRGGSREGSRGKSGKKKFYRDKMAELMKSEDYVKQEYNYVAAMRHFEQGRQPLSREEQKKRNSQSAKKSRDRKKEYIAFL